MTYLFIRAPTWTGGTWRRVWNESPPRHTSSPSKKTWTRSKKKHQQTGNKYPHQLPILDDLPCHLAALLLLHLQGASLRQVGHRYLTATCHLKHNLSQQYGEVKEYTETTIGWRLWWFSPLDYDGSVSLCPEGERSRRSHCELPPREVDCWIRWNQVSKSLDSFTQAIGGLPALGGRQQGRRHVWSPGSTLRSRFLLSGGRKSLNNGLPPTEMSFTLWCSENWH